MSREKKDKLEATPIEFARRCGLYAERQDRASGIKLVMPLAPNINHVGTMYAGALFTLAEIMGGAAYRTYMKHPEVFPIVKALNIKFTKPARTDIYAEYKMDEDLAARLVTRCLEQGKADYEISLELKDEAGVVVAKSEAFYQLRRGKTF